MGYMLGMKKQQHSNLRNLGELYHYAATEYANEKSFLTRTPDGFDGPTYAELYEDGLNLAAALAEFCALEAREHVAILADNRLEWMLCDYAVILNGAADVPRGTDATREEIGYIVNHAECRIVIIENRNVWDKLVSCTDKLPQVKHVVTMTAFETPHSPWKIHSLPQLVEAGRSLDKAKVLSRLNAIHPNDLFTLIYTSGTTGEPKGVMLTHGNIMSQIRNLPLGFEKNDVMLSILPVWHIFERAFEIISIACGAKTAYTNVKNLKADLSNVKPTFMASAPRLWESIYNGIAARIAESSPIRKGLFHAAVRLSATYRNALRELKAQNLYIFPQNMGARTVSIVLALFTLAVTFIPALVLDAIVLSKIRAATGGRLRATISGGGALPQHIDQFFNDIGIPVLEGYGMTETSPIIAVRLPENAVIGTVGPLYAETEIRIVDIATGAVIYPGKDYFGKKGELHVKGPQVMAGYFKNPEATRKVLHDGFMNTGDLVVMTANDCLKIVGRSKETIVLSNGENVEPTPIEAKLLESPYIEQCMVVGQDKKFLGLLIVPRVEALKNLGDTRRAIAENAETQKWMRAEIQRLISAQNGFKAFERIGGFAVLETIWEKDRELTAKLSLKRHAIVEIYADEIEKIYAE